MHFDDFPDVIESLIVNGNAKINSSQHNCSTLKQMEDLLRFREVVVEDLITSQNSDVGLVFGGPI